MQHSFTVYVLYSTRSNKLYIGFTSNLEQRLLSHNHLASKGFTRKYRPWTLIHTETFNNKSYALFREKALKSGQGRKWNLQFAKTFWTYKAQRDQQFMHLITEIATMLGLGS